jgi:hypothetical protein
MGKHALARSFARGLLTLAMIAAGGPSLPAQTVAAPGSQAAPSAPTQPPPSPASDPQTPAAASYVVTSDAAAFLFFVKPDRETEFQEVVAEMRGALSASTDPVRRAQAAGWKVFRAAEAPPPVPGTPPGVPSSVVYVFLASPAVSGADYSPANLLGEALGSTVGPVWLKYRDAIAAPAARATLTLVHDFGAGPPR